ncbi:hypothetical protein C7271_20525 [filamentous cyanobacterium CCP5]|nr:hypothetical protein C7271_20525 [filamentous cyanobacterium CCP5]
MLDGTVRTHEDLQTLFRDQDVPLVGLLPLVIARNPYGAVLAEDSPYSDGYERLRSNIRLAGAQEGGREPKAILITSTRDREGKSFTAYSLGIASARAGRRTLIVEADLHSPSEAFHLGVNLPPGAQREPLRYYGGFSADPIQMVPQVANLYIAPSPGPQRQAAAVLESSEMQRFLVDARGRFDLVIVDAPSLSRSNDAILLEAETDGLVLVTRPAYTEKAVLTEALEQLLETEDLEVLGGIVNGAQIPLATSTPTRPSTPSQPPPPLVSPVEF